MTVNKTFLLTISMFLNDNRCYDYIFKFLQYNFKILTTHYMNITYSLHFKYIIKNTLFQLDSPF